MPLRRQGLHYGWAIVAALAVTETISWGIIYYSFPVFLQVMERDLGASRVAITGALSVGLGVSALAAVPVGWWLDRFGPRALMTAGSCLPAGPAIIGHSLHAAMRTVVFWILAGVFAVGTFTTTSISVHLLPYLTQRGYPAQFAAVAVGWMGAMQLLGRVFYLPVASRLGPVGVTA